MAKLLWNPSEEACQSTQVWGFIQRINIEFNAQLESFSDLHTWSCENPEQFWSSFWDFTGIISKQKSSAVLTDGDNFLASQWFPESTLNFAENLLQRQDTSTAIVFWAEDKQKQNLSYQELYQRVTRLSAWLKQQGVTKGDRVAGFLPNMPEAIIAMLATTSLGAIWTSCSPDFGVQGVLDRFGQVAPKVFICVDAYYYNGKVFDCTKKNAGIIKQLSTLKSVLLVRFIHKLPIFPEFSNTAYFDDVVMDANDPALNKRLTFEQVAFNDPVFIMFSSGTTGVPKCIVHGVGGTLIQHKKEHQLHCDIKSGDRVFYFTTCGWMMWNWLVSGLASGATLMLYDGSPFLKDNDNILFDYAEAERFTLMGVSAKYLDAANKKSLAAVKTHDLSSLQVILSTGSVLSDDGFDYVYKEIKSDLCLSSISGGTDIISCFALGSKMLAVYRGQLQTRGLGMAVEVWDDSGQAVLEEKGELVCTQTFPSKPIGFWNDPKQEKYRKAYFEKYPNTWCHGDYVSLQKNGGMVFHGRSDTVLNPGGVRIGTAEIYRQVERLDDVFESIVVGQKWQDDIRIVLFVKLKEKCKLDDALKNEIRLQIRNNTTPRHVPAKIIQVNDIPRTKSGKIVELAVQKAIHNKPIENEAALANPEALLAFYQMKELLND